MEAKNYLRNVKKYDVLVKNKMAELAQCKESITSITAMLGGERVQSSGNPHKMTDAIAKYIDLEKETNEYIDMLIDAKKEALKTIETLTADQYDILHKRYIQQLSFKEIAFSRDTSESAVTTIHGRALAALQKILDEREVTEA